MDLEGLAGDNGNLIVIPPDFEYVPAVPDEGDILAEEPRGSRKIGFNNTEAKRSGDFCKGKKPVLIVTDSDDISDLDNIAAIRR